MKRGMIVLAAIAAFAIGVVTMAVAHGDFGVSREDALKAKSRQLFGVGTPVPASSSTSIDQATALADPRKLVKLAKGLHAHTVTRFGSTPGQAFAAPIIDMMALWPNSSDPQWLIACNETEEATEPGLQRINLAT